MTTLSRISICGDMLSRFIVNHWPRAPSVIDSRDGMAFRVDHLVIALASEERYESVNKPRISDVDKRQRQGKRVFAQF